MKVHSQQTNSCLPVIPGLLNGEEPEKGGSLLHRRISVRLGFIDTEKKGRPVWLLYRVMQFRNLSAAVLMFLPAIFCKLNEKG
jgi:hypothetical protein